MKKRMNLKKVLAVFCVAALFANVLPVSGFAMDLEAYYQQALAEYQAAYAEYEAALQRQLEQYEADLKAYRENDGFNVEAVFDYLMSLTMPEEQKAFYHSLKDNQRRLLVEYMMKKAEKGEFKGFDDPEFALKDEIGEVRKAIEKERGITTPTDAEAVESQQEQADENPEPDEAPALTEEEQFVLDYAPYIEMYEKYGTAGNYDAIPYDAFLKIQAMSSAPAEKESAEEEVLDEESSVKEESDTEKEPLEEQPPTEKPEVEEHKAEEEQVEEEKQVEEEELAVKESVEEEVLDKESSVEEESDAEKEPLEEEPPAELLPSWSIQIPNNPPVTYGTEVATVSVATPVDVENIGDSTIYLTVTSNCVFTGKADEMPVTLCVGGVPVMPGEAAVYGTVTAAGADYAAVTLVFSEDGWSALASGRYSMTISFNSYIG
ncbi:MAG: hypothetical protein J6M66_04470 [Lachnospiraceae bacterium]|nr:hypothetical protein [Lachnospiraceae bacterium]